MCWGVEASLGMVVAGTVATGVTAARGERPGIWITLGWFTIMEVLQAASYLVIDQCGDPMNRALTAASVLHIALQPFFINAFALALLPNRVESRIATGVWITCTACFAVMLLQFMPIAAFGTCRAGTPLCGDVLCTVSGHWHLAWDVPYNGLTNSLEAMLGMQLGFPSYLVAAFLLPALYGAWRFALLNFASGPVLSNALTSNPNEMPAVWCLFSIVILVLALSPAIRGHFEARDWPLWPSALRP